MELKSYSFRDLWLNEDSLPAWVRVAAVHVAGLALVVGANSLLAWESPAQRLARVGGSWLGLGANVAAIAKTRQLQLGERYRVMRAEARADLFAFNTAQQVLDYQAQPAIVAGLPPLDIPALLSEATGLALLGPSGSGKTCLAKRFAAEFREAQILVLDPHDDPAASGWDGLTVVRDYPAIAEQLDILLDQLDHRRKQSPPLVILSDEWPAVRAWCKQQGNAIADRYLLRISSEGRKFGYFPIFCSQSGNIKALGLEGMGDFLENFHLIRLGRVAIKYARNLPDQAILKRVKSTAYPLLVGEEIYQHPTHGHYQRAAKNQPPIGLQPLASAPLTVPLAEGVQVSTRVLGCTRVQPDADCVQSLERLWRLDCTHPHAPARDDRPGDETGGTHQPARDSTRVPTCPHCGSRDTRTNGTNRSGSPRWRCKSCGKTWTV